MFLNLFHDKHMLEDKLFVEMFSICCKISYSERCFLPMVVSVYLFKDKHML